MVQQVSLSTFFYFYVPKKQYITLKLVNTPFSLSPLIALALPQGLEDFGLKIAPKILC